jgi:hypothetical protein
MGLATLVHQTPLFFMKTMVILGIQLLVMFCMLTILCEGGGISRMVVVTLEDPSIPIIIPQHIFEIN